eukprot:2628363-Prymnesium_polylepis.1
MCGVPWRGCRATSRGVRERIRGTFLHLWQRPDFAKKRTMAAAASDRGWLPRRRATAPPPRRCARCSMACLTARRERPRSCS